MNSFSIRDIENLSGIKAHTLRIWEQRYQIITPKRKDSLHRYFDNEDLKKVLRIAYLYNTGYKISKIAELNEAELLKRTVTEVEKETPAPLIVHQLLEAGIDFDEQKFEDIFLRSIHKIGFESTIVEVALPYLEKIGILWMSDAAIPAQEHFTSNIIIKRLLTMIDALPQTTANDSASFALFTPQREHHEIPLLFMQYLLKKSGKKVYYLGPDISFEILEELCMEKKVKHLYFQLLTNFTNFSLDNYISGLSRKFPAQKIIMAGLLTKEVSVKLHNVWLLKSLEETIAFGKNPSKIFEALL